MSEAAWEDEPEYADESGWPPWARPFLTAMEMQPSISAAARMTGVHRATVHRWIEKDTALAAAVTEARQTGLDLLEEMAQKRALSGQTVTKVVKTVFPDGREQTVTTTETHISDSLLMFYLKAWRPMYRDSYRVEQTGRDGGPIEFEQRVRDLPAEFRDVVLRLVESDEAEEGAG